MSSFSLNSRLVIRSIVSDMAKGSIPLTVKSWTELHDHVDANEYLLGIDELTGPWSDETIATANEIIADVTGWLKLMAEVNPEPTIIQMICSIPVDEDFN